VQRYDLERGVTQEFFAYVVPVEINIKIDDKRKDTVNFASSQVELRKFFVNVGGEVGVYVWVNDDGEVIKLSIPIQGIEVFKEGYKPVSVKAEVDTLKKLYSSEDITFKSGNLKLAGTVTVPQDVKTKHPAVIIISGSGPQDRDGKTPELLFSVQYKALAHVLSNSGILVLRYDDRGVEKSEGDFLTASLTDFVSDVKAGINYLRSRSDVDKTRICLIGHSEGAIIAPMIASEDTMIQAIVLMAGTAKPFDQVILEQQDYVMKKQNVPEEMQKQAIDQQKDFFAWVRGETQWSEEKVRQLEKLADQKKWLLEHFQHDPIQTIKQVKCKVLILQGGKDRQVFEEHARMLNLALNESKNKNHTLKIFPNLDHLFCKTEGEGDYAEYANIERPLDQEFLNFLTEWLKKEL
jgi:dipeptidyl aminopeptidase/acylaminoacyl peptidase